MTRPSPLARARHGSLVVMAIVFLTVLFVVIMAYHWSSVSTHKMFHHTYYAEKAIALIDGLTAIARGVAQDNLEDIIDNLEVGKERDLTKEVEKLAKELKLIDEEDAEYKKSVKPDVKCTVKMLAKDKFKTEYKTIKGDEKEKVGKIEITIEVQFTGFLTDFSSSKKIAKSEYEFKKLRAMPTFFRHFSLFVKNGIPQDEKEDDYAGGQSNFNNLVNDRHGQAQSGGAILLQSAQGGGLQAAKLPKVEGEKKTNPFYSAIGYAYLGGGDGKNKAYLNLTAGGGGGKPENVEKSPFGEDFMLYRGENTDFYRVVSTEFDDFLKSAAAADTSDSGGGQTRTKLSFKALWAAVKGVFSRVGDYFKKAFKLFNKMDDMERSNDNPSARSNNLPLYYVVRKDYGYASEWGEDPKYRKFGFGQGKVVSNSLHLYNNNYEKGEPTPTVVLGNVYRRCLSLSGYKQRRGEDNPSVNRPFEVQAGPVEYFKDSAELLKRTSDWSKPEDGGGPIWVWDARVDWSFVEDNKEPDVDGIYVPVSGAGLFGRLVPGLRRFWDEDKALASKLFNASIAPPDRLMGGGSGEGDTAILVNGTDVEDEQKVSPLFVMFEKAQGFDMLESMSQQQIAARQGTLFGEMGDKQNSPYFEEMMRNFSYTSFYMPDDMKNSLNGDAKKAATSAGTLWGNLLDIYKEFDAVKSKVKAMPASAIPDARKKERWAGGKTQSDIYPWSLPDPWADSGNAADKNFEKALKSAGAQKLFEQYFKPMMTNPGRVLPYNYSMRFWFTELKDIFAMDPKDRLQLLGKDIIPEIRDAAFGYIEGSGNDYMKVKQGEITDPTLNDEVLTQIAAKRAGDKTLQGGYFFMDDYAQGVNSPAKVDLGDIYGGDHYSYEEMNQSQFDDRFLKSNQGEGGATIGLSTVVKVKDFSIGKVTVQGGGAILSDTPIKITGDIKSRESSVPFMMKAPAFEIDPGVEKIEAMLVCTKEFKFKGARECTLEGSLIAEGWDPFSWSSQSGAMKRILFNPTYKQDPEKSPYVHNLEPRVRKFVIEGQN